MSPDPSPNNPDWPSQYKRIRDNIQAHLSNTPDTVFTHISSTALPTNLSAHPNTTIDILLTVPASSIPRAHAILVSKSYSSDSTHLETLGTIFTPSLETKQDQEQDADQASHTIYLCATDSLPARAHLATLTTLYTSRTTRWPPLPTARLTLRELNASDAEALYLIERCAENARYQSWEPWTLDVARERTLDAVRESFKGEGREVLELGVVWEGVVVGRVGARVGVVGVGVGVGLEGELGEGEGTQTRDLVSVQAMEEPASKHKHADLWFSFLPSAQGKGLATEAMTAFIAELVKREKNQRGGALELEIECDPRNTGSWKMAQRLGFTKHSLTERAWECKGEWVGSLVYRKMV